MFISKWCNNCSDITFSSPLERTGRRLIGFLSCSWTKLSLAREPSLYMFMLCLILCLFQCGNSSVLTTSSDISLSSMCYKMLVLNKHQLKKGLITLKQFCPFFITFCLNFRNHDKKTVFMNILIQHCLFLIKTGREKRRVTEIKILRFLWKKH